MEQDSPPAPEGRALEADVLYLHFLPPEGQLRLLHVELPNKAEALRFENFCLAHERTDETLWAQSIRRSRADEEKWKNIYLPDKESDCSHMYQWLVGQKDGQLITFHLGTPDDLVGTCATQRVLMAWLKAFDAKTIDEWAMALELLVNLGEMKAGDTAFSLTNRKYAGNETADAILAATRGILVWLHQFDLLLIAHGVNAEEFHEALTLETDGVIQYRDDQEILSIPTTGEDCWSLYELIRQRSWADDTLRLFIYQKEPDKVAAALLRDFCRQTNFGGNP